MLHGKKDKETSAPATGASAAPEQKHPADSAGETPSEAGPTPAPSGRKPDEEVTGISFPVVGIGASAGGLSAFRKLLSSLPNDTGMAFVLIQHLDPHHESLLSLLLKDSTRMPVNEASDNQSLLPNHIYVIPPNCSLGIHHGVLQLLERIVEKGKHLPVDYFFRLLSEDLGSKAIGVVLSGTASDGTLGLKSIKVNSGITFAQNEASAEFYGMPGSAVAAGCVDYVLSPAEIAKELARIARHPYLLHERPIHNQPEAGDVLGKIFMLLRSRTGNDFTYYKQSTIMRRIKRRMMVHKLERLQDYLRYMQATPIEVDLLFQDLLINVTGFFRDPDSFESLREKVFPKILKDRRDDQPIRVWVPGCSTGEEAYSLAMSLVEHLGDRGPNPQVQIFATDIDGKAIETARNGIYPERIIEDISQVRLRRFFLKVTGGYQISKVIRDMCVFAVQNVTKDPPFSKLDLVCCRNLLIYLGSVLQKRILQLFHYSLIPNGFLMLGTSESVGGHADLFGLLDKKNKIYIKKSVAGRLSYEFNTQTFHPNPPVTDRAGTDVHIPFHDLQQEADRYILAEYGPAAVVINADLEILHFRGDTGPYLSPAPGVASLSLLKMARQELSVELRAAIHNADKQGETACKQGIHYQRNGSQGLLDIRVKPMLDSMAGGRHFLVLFEERPLPKLAPEMTPEQPHTAKDERISELERELGSTREYMQSIIEDQEGINEELKSANEEIQSTNEELQSTNEELETAQEELQSTNEELATVNEELENRNVDLALANNDLINLLSSVNLPILMLDMDMNIRQFTPQAEKLLNLIGSDLGRPIGNIKPNIDIPDLEAIIADVVDRMISREMELKDHKGHWYSVRIRPYKTIDNHIEGVVITFIDVDQIKEVERLNNILVKEQQLAIVMRDANDAITMQDFNGKILAWNPSARRMYGYTEAQALAMNARAMVPESRWPEHVQMMETLKNGGVVDAFQTERLRQDGREISVHLTVTALVNETGIPYAVATTERNIATL